jgi:hypothetical protein
VTFEYETGVAVSGTQSLWMAGVLTPHQSTEALSLTAMTLNCRPLRAELRGQCLGCVGADSLLPSLPSGRIACIFFRLRLRQLRWHLLPFKLHRRTHRDVDGGVHVPVSDEVALRTPPPILT